MPRRLGDDPLSRAKAAQAPALAPGDEVQATATTRSSSSCNDVFFKRQGEAESRSSPNLALSEAPEISEISEIPEIREVAALPAIASPNQALSAGAIEVQAQFTELPAEAETPVVATPENAVATEAPAARMPTSSVPVEATSQPAKAGGFFKRLFGKFK